MTITLPYMSLLQPQVGVDTEAAGEAATTYNTGVIDGHGHTGTNTDGKQIVTAAININADLSLNSFNLNNVRALRLNNQTGTLSSTGDSNCVYFVNGNAYVNNGAGIPIQLTAGSAPITTVSNTYPFIANTGNLTILDTATYVVVYESATSGGSSTIILPATSTVPIGRFFIIKDSGAGASNNITIAVSGSDTIDGASSVPMIYNYDEVMVISDGNGHWLLFTNIMSGDVVGNNQSCEVVSLTGANNTVTIPSASLVFGGATKSGLITLPEASGITGAAPTGQINMINIDAHANLTIGDTNNCAGINIFAKKNSDPSGLQSINLIATGGAAITLSTASTGNITLSAAGSGVIALAGPVTMNNKLTSTYAGTGVNANSMAGDLDIAGSLTVSGVFPATITANGSPGLIATTAQISNVVSPNIDTSGFSTIMLIGATNATTIDIGASQTTTINLAQANCSINMGTTSTTICTFPGALNMLAVASTPATPASGYCHFYFNSGTNKLCFVDSTGTVHTITSS